MRSWWSYGLGLIFNDLFAYFCYVYAPVKHFDFQIRFLLLISILDCCYPAGVCSVWGGFHYMTFDGKSYSFNDNCSSYLVKEIITKYNLTIIINNSYCDPSESTFCPQALIVIYESYNVVLTQLKTSGEATNVVSNDSKCHLLFQC